MPEAEVHMIDELHSMEGRTEDQSYASRVENDDVAKRLKMLFKPEDADSKDKDFDAAEAVNEAYETVNEGETTDTTSGIDDDSLMERSSQDGTTKADKKTS